MTAHLQPRSYQRLAMPGPTPGSFLKSALEAPPSLSCRRTPFESCTALFALRELKRMLGINMGSKCRHGGQHWLGQVKQLTV